MNARPFKTAVLGLLNLNFLLGKGRYTLEFGSNLRLTSLLQQGDSVKESIKVLNLSDRDAARVLQKMETLENSDVFLIQSLLEEKQELAIQVRHLEAALQPGIASDSEKELFDQLQAEMESCLILLCQIHSRAT